MGGLHRNMLVLIGILAIIDLVQAEDQQGFISLDCGLPIDASPYTEPYNGIIFTSDEKFVQSGKTGRVGSNWSNYLKVYMHLRYFPDGKKNCINLSITKDTTYVIRADFLYGNYDGINSYPTFDLYLGSNKWVTVDLQGEEEGLSEEIIHVSRSNSLQVCIVKTGISTPLISSLELRPLRNGSYLTQSGSLKSSSRQYFNNSDGYMRYPQDIHDRNWYPMFQPSNWRQITTSLNINTSNEYEPPKAAISMAATPANVSAPLTITWPLRPLNAKFYLYLHFAEIQELGSNATREFNVLLNGEIIHGPYSPQKLQVHTLQHTSPMTCDGGECVLQLVKTSRSTLPPLINGLEALTVLELPVAETNLDDFAAIKNIQTTYELRRTDWQGDPCNPKQFSWDGLNCSYLDISTPPRIISLDLSSNGLRGTIEPAIQNLTELEKLDLSNNNLTGGVPEFLAKMKKLLDINLSGNNISGSVPQVLLNRVKEEGLKLNLNPHPCSPGSCKPTKDEKDNKKVIVPVIASVVAVAVVISVLVIIYISRKEKTGSKAQQELSRVPETEKFAHNPEQSILTTKKRFTYSDVLVMTKNFQKVLGNGGFGVVYHGYLHDDDEVAVKVLSQSSTQGYKHFKAEVELLMRVHHVNLVSLIGYCDEGDRLALIYEFMPNGDLKGHLSAGKLGGSALSWASRLRIATEAAQGLEYLHIGCKPPMIHRDVKSTNILLDQNIQAKLADFGLSRSFPVVGETHVSTVVAGTPGYLDPDYFRTNWLTEKSDVYSFGIVLLEIITNRPVLDQSRQRAHIAEWIGLLLSKGDLREIMDRTMLEDYDVGSAWKALEIAMLCVNPSSIGRPDMSKVVSELKECMRLENYKRRGSQDTGSRIFQETSMSFDMEGTPPRAR